jgi:hypothetical protein
MIFRNVKNGMYFPALLCAVIFSLAATDDSAAAAQWLSSITNTKVPTRLAIDGKGNLYATEPRDANRLLVFDRKGNFVRALGGLQKPIGVAVDGSRIYVGNEGSQTVDVYTMTDTGFTRAFMLGTGRGEFKSPNSIALGMNGLIYVADTKDHRIKAYNADGSQAFTFGGWGKNNGQFNLPLGLAIDDNASEIYVTDMGIYTDANGSNAGARVQVFDLSGGFKRSFGTYGTGDGKLMRPLGVAVDGAGKVYVTDGFQGWIGVFDANGIPVETIYDPAHPMATPIGIAIGRDKRLFVASSNGPSIDVYGLSGYTTLTVSPASLVFEAQEGGPAPATQAVQVINGGSGTLAWTARSEGAPWLVTPVGGSSGPAPDGTSALTASVNTAGLTAGTYAGTIIITAETGAEERIPVSLTVTAPPAILSVVPGALNFKAQQGGPAPLPLSFSINNIGSGTMTWSATTIAPWLTLGISGPFLNISPATTGLKAGTYSGNVTVAAPGAQGSPANVAVSLQVVHAGTVKVTSNITDAAYDMTGPVSYNGSGKTWRSDEVTPGDYTITFRRVPGYLKPMARRFTVKTGQEIDLAGDYGKKPVATHIIAGSVSNSSKDMKVAVLPLDSGKARQSFTAFKHATSVRAAAGDLDARGSDTIVVTDHKRTINVFTDQGIQLASYKLPEGYNHADVVVGDLDRDGAADIIIGADREKEPHRVIKLFSYAANALQDKGTIYAEDREGRFTMALGDINDDGALEVLLADKKGISALAVQQAGAALELARIWVRSGDYDETPQIAAGDINGDGVSEIAVSYEGKGRKERDRDSEHERDSRKGHDSRKERDEDRERALITFLKGSGEEYGLTIEPFKDLGYERPATVAMGDIDGDGLDELVAGAGPDEHSDPLIRIFESDGTYAGVTMKPMDGKFGMNVGLGVFQQ